MGSNANGRCKVLLFAAYGGWSEPVVRLFRRMQDKVRNKLTIGSTRTK